MSINGEVKWKAENRTAGSSSIIRKVKIGEVSKLAWEGSTHELGGRPSECVSLEIKGRECQRKEWLLLLLLRRFSRVRLCVTPKTAAHQAPPSLGLSRQEHWSGLPFPSSMHESEVIQLCPTLSNTMDCSPPGSSNPCYFPSKSTGVGCHCLLWYCI